MGIPYYFYKLSQKYNNIVSNKKPENTDIYCIDFNGIIHNVAQELIYEKDIVDVEDKIIEGVSSGAKAYIDNVDSSVTLGSRLFYHQSPETGFKQFQTGETIAETNGNGEGVIETHNNPGEVDRLSGEVLYLDNRVAVSRTANQSEDIKVIIQL